MGGKKGIENLAAIDKTIEELSIAMTKVKKELAYYKTFDKFIEQFKKYDNALIVESKTFTYIRD